DRLPGIRDPLVAELHESVVPELEFRCHPSDLYGFRRSPEGRAMSGAALNVHTANALWRSILAPRRAAMPRPMDAGLSLGIMPMIFCAPAANMASRHSWKNATPHAPRPSGLTPT